MAGFVTPTYILILGVIVALGYGVWRFTRADARAASAAAGRRLRGRSRRWRLTKPTRRQAHVTRLIASALVAFVLTRAVALPLFLLVFFAVWVCGYAALARLYR